MIVTLTDSAELGAGLALTVNDALPPSVTAEPAVMLTSGVIPPPSSSVIVSVWTNGSLRAYPGLLTILTVTVSEPSDALSSVMAMGMTTDDKPALTLIVRVLPDPPLIV